MKRLLLTLGLVATAAISAACSSAAAQPLPAGPVDPSGPTIVAKDMAFAPSTVEIAANKNVTIHFDNQDSAPHNVAIYKDQSASEKVFVQDPFSGPKAVTYQVGPLAAGSYFFRCDVHTDMKGTLTVK